MGPFEYRRRCNRLGARGLRPGLVAALLLAGSAGLLREMEQSDDDELARLRWR